MRGFNVVSRGDMKKPFKAGGSRSRGGSKSSLTGNLFYGSIFVVVEILARIH